MRKVVLVMRSMRSSKIDVNLSYLFLLSENRLDLGRSIGFHRFLHTIGFKSHKFGK